MRNDVTEASGRAMMGKVRIYLDGEEVTNDCRAFDTDEGWVVLYRTDEDGHKYIEAPGKAATVTKHGRVTFRWKSSIPDAVGVTCRAMGIDREEFDRIASGEPGAR